VTFGVGWFVDLFFDFGSHPPSFLWVEQAAWRVVKRDDTFASCFYANDDGFNDEFRKMLVGRTVVSASVVRRADLVLGLDDGSAFEVWALTTDLSSDWSLHLPAGVIGPSEEGFAWEPGREAW
jgi:hypothetical protein